MYLITLPAENIVSPGDGVAEWGLGGFRLPYKSFDRVQVGVEINTVNYHFNEIFKSGELEENSVIRKSCRFG